MKKPSKILSMVLAVMMVMSSVVGLNSTAAKAAGISGEAYSPSGAGALDASISETLTYDLYDKEGNVVEDGQTLTQGTNAENILNDLKLIDLMEYEEVAFNEINRGDVYYIEFVQDAKQVENYAINEVQLLNGSSVVAILDFKYTEKANDGSIKYTYAFTVPNDLSTSAMELSLNFVVEQRGDETPSAQVEFGGFHPEVSIDEAISVTAEEKALTNGEAFKLTVKPNKGYGFTGTADYGLNLSLYTKNSTLVKVDGQEVVTAEKVAGKLYEFEISSTDVTSIFTAVAGNEFGPFKLVVAENASFAAEISETAVAETITLAEPAEGGRLKTTSPVNVKFGETFNIEVTPDADYQLVSLASAEDNDIATSLDVVDQGKAWYEVNGNKATVMLSTDLKADEVGGKDWASSITIKPKLEKAKTIEFKNSALYTSDKVKFLFENGKTTSDKLYSKDTVKVTLVNDNKDKVLNEALKTFLATGIENGGNWNTEATADDVLFTYIGEVEAGNYEYELSCRTSWPLEIDTSTVVVLDDSKSYVDPQPEDFATDPVEEPGYTFVPSFYFNSSLYFENATYAIDKIALYDYDEANEKHNSTLINELTEGENCLLQFELNTNNGDGREVRDLISLDYNGKDILANVTSETDKESGVTTYSYKFVAGKEAEFNFNFGDIKSAYLTTVVEGDGKLYFVDAWGKIESISEIDAAIAEGETTVYIEVFSEEELVSFVVTDEDGKEVETKFIESNSTYELVVPKEAKLTITAKFGEEAVSYPIINGAPEVDKDTNNGYLTITLPALGQTEAYVGDAIKVTAVPNEGYKLDKVLAYVGEAADGALVPMENNEGSFIVPENVTDYVKFVAIFVEAGETPVEPDPKPEYPTANEWHQNEDGTWSFIDEEGQLLTGWQNNIKGWEGQWFYFDINGIMLTDWQTGIPGWKSAWFYFDKTTGVMKTDWQNNIPGYEGQWFFFDKSTGEMYCNSWYQNWDGSWYYFGTDGVMLTNTYTPDGYYVDANGVWVA